MSNRFIYRTRTQQARPRIQRIEFMTLPCCGQMHRIARTPEIDAGTDITLSPCCGHRWEFLQEIFHHQDMYARTGDSRWLM